MGFKDHTKSGGRGLNFVPAPRTTRRLKILAVKDGSSMFGRIRFCAGFKIMCRFDRQKRSELGAGLLGVCPRSADVGLVVRDSGFQLLSRDFGCDYSMSPSK